MSEKREKRALEPARQAVWPWGPFWDLGFGDLLREPFAARTSRTAWMPATDVAENDDAYVVTVEVPGAKREDVGIELDGEMITIRGEKRSEREEKGERRHYVERCYGSFSRSFTLPRDTDRERIKASFQDGVLTVEIPKTEKSKPRAIDIKSS